MPVVTSTTRIPSARQVELLEAAYQYMLEHGMGDLSLRPLAAAIGSSPRVLLYLFDSKEGLIRALLARARAEELALLEQADSRELHNVGAMPKVAASIWAWLVSAEHRALLRLWVEAYAHSLVDPDGPWGGFAQSTIDDWLAVLAAAQSPADRRSKKGEAERTLVLAVLRGALLDLLASGDVERVSAAVDRFLKSQASPQKATAR